MHRLTLQTKVFLALTALLLVLLALFVGFSRLGLQRGLGPYIAELEIARMDWLAYRVQSTYAQHGGWQTLQVQPELWRALRLPGDPAASPSGPHQTAAPTPPDSATPEALLLAEAATFKALPIPTEDTIGPGTPVQPQDGLARRLGIVDADNQLIAGNAPLPGHARTALRDHQGRVIGALVMNPPEGLEREVDRAFLSQQLGFVAWTGAIGLSLALLLSGWLAHRWLRPIGALVRGAQNLAAGQLHTRVREQHDSAEFSHLIHTFNTMAAQLAEMEISRRRWIGDMAHELRTPLAAMRAEIEAVQDGIRPFNDDTAERLHRQVMRLAQLVGDLRTSAHAQETPQSSALPRVPLPPSTPLAPIAPIALLLEAAASMQPRFAQRGVALNWAALMPPGVTPAVHMLGDASQLHRVYINLLENSLRYTDAGGQLQLRAHRPTPDHIALLWDDTAPGVSTAELTLIFERLYRTEASRQRPQGDLGGSGLGLAICQQLVQGLGGQITASHSPLGGLRITLTFPLMAH